MLPLCLHMKKTPVKIIITWESHDGHMTLTGTSGWPRPSGQHNGRVTGSQERVALSIDWSHDNHMTWRNTLTPSFQMAKFHPPTVRMISRKKGDLWTVVIEPQWAGSKTCSGFGANGIRRENWSRDDHVTYELFSHSPDPFLATNWQRRVLHPNRMGTMTTVVVETVSVVTITAETHVDVMFVTA